MLERFFASCGIAASSVVVWQGEVKLHVGGEPAGVTTELPDLGSGDSRRPQMNLACVVAREFLHKHHSVSFAEQSLVR